LTFEGADQNIRCLAQISSEVIPAKAGIQATVENRWIVAFAEMT
jgi:hypothetical protein